MKRKDYEKMVAENERKEKRDRWLRELEMRDEEDRAWKDRLAKRNRGEGEGEKGVTELVKEKTKEIKDQALSK